MSSLDINDLVTKNKIYFANQGIEYAIFEPTETGLRKSILDATQPVRSYFSSENFHLFDKQNQGIDNKVIKKAHFVTEFNTTHTKVSLYRPETKNGDPRMWFSSLNTFSKPLDKIAIVIFNNELYLFNFSQSDLELSKSDSDITLFINEYTRKTSCIAEELLEKLKIIARKPIKSSIKGDTAIGMAIEEALGIAANSSKNPDYNGIEIKSARSKKSRENLFAQVADWKISPCKSSAEILEKYGYIRDSEFKLYCTISTEKPNSQGLHFFYDESTDYLIERDREKNDVAIWQGYLLRNRLAEKHAETFWINAKSFHHDGQEYFNLISVTHTRRPLLTQLIPLIKQGFITMDHLIKRSTGAKPSVQEKGPLFKITEKSLHLLFPEPQQYSLQ